MAQYEKLELIADDVIDDVSKTLHQWIWDARQEAVKEGIKANTVIINKHFAKVNAHIFNFNGSVLDMPPMICGLEVKLSEELPEGYDFALCEAYETERERLIRNAKAEVAREIFDEIASMIGSKFPMKACGSIDGKHIYDPIEYGKQKALNEVLGGLVKLKMKYIGEQNDGTKQKDS